MFGTLLMKEVHETVTGGKFLIATVLCLFLIPFGIYVSLQEYEQQFRNYQNTEQLYQERSENKIGSTFKAEGYRPPSPLSIFAAGIEDYIPNKAVTTPQRGGIFSDRSDINGIVNISNEKGIGNPQSALFGRIDYLFNVSVILSILTLIFIVTGITAEREHGTLKLVMSNSVPRGKLLAAKIIGGYLVFLAPFILAFIVGMIMLATSPAFPLDNHGNLGAIVVIFGATLVFLACMFALGMLISTSTGNSMTAMIGSVLVWVVIVLIVPKASPMIARIAHPVEADDVVTNRIRIARSQLEDELMNREQSLFAEVLARHGLSSFNEYTASDERSRIEQEQDELVQPVRDDFFRRMADETERLLAVQENEKLAQQRIAINLSRISPVSCFTYLVSELAGTGVLGISEFDQQADQFQNQVEQEIYENYVYQQYGTGNMLNVGYRARDGFDQSALAVPHITNYRHTTVTGALQARWIDLFLIAFYTLLFFVAGFVRFLRYDVR